MLSREQPELAEQMVALPGVNIGVFSNCRFQRAEIDCYRLTDKGVKVAAMFVLFHKRVCGPLANTLFHHRPTKTTTPPAKIEAAYHRADVAIQQLIELIAA